MKLSINFKTDNAAFEDRETEVKRILEKVVSDITTKDYEFNHIIDINGNNIGNWKLTY